MITVNDILGHLVARTCAPSSMGAQLDRLRYGIQGTQDPFQQRDQIEGQLMATAQLLRCIDAFEKRSTLDNTSKSIRKSKTDVPYKALAKVATALPTVTDGSIALGVLRAYQERARQGQEILGLIAVYLFVQQVAPQVLPDLPKDTKEVTTAFKEGEAKRALSFVAELYADAVLALSEHVRVYNKKQ